MYKLPYFVTYLWLKVWRRSFILKILNLGRHPYLSQLRSNISLWYTIEYISNTLINKFDYMFSFCYRNFHRFVLCVFDSLHFVKCLINTFSCLCLCRPLFITSAFSLDFPCGHSEKLLHTFHSNVIRSILEKLVLMSCNDDVTQACLEM